MNFFSPKAEKIPELRGLVTAYRLAGMPPEYVAPNTYQAGPEYLHGCRVVRQWSPGDAESAEIRGILSQSGSYGSKSQGARGYVPAFAFSFGQDSEAVDVLICVACRWVAFHQNGQSFRLAPTDAGLGKLQEIYDRVIENRQPVPVPGAALDSSLAQA